MVSVRRFEKEGRLAYVKKGIKLNLYRAFKGEIHNDKVVKYEFDAFDKPDTDLDNMFLDKIEKQLIKIEEKSRYFHINAKLNRKNNKKVDTNQLRSQFDEYAHLVKELDAYLSLDERREQRERKFLSFFKFRK
jgi:hypothetical protein